MAILPIVKYGDEVLRRPTEPVTRIDDQVQRLVDDMVDTMYAAPGVGLAANQVGVSLNLMIIDLTVGDEPDNLHVFINPKIVEMEGEQSGEEGCLSLPDFTEIVATPHRVRVDYLDLEGKRREIVGTELLARALRHEIDHLRGVLYIDYLRGLKKDRILRKVRKLAKAGAW